MTKAFEDAVVEAETLMGFSDPEPEALVAIGYRAALQDAVKTLNEAGAVKPQTKGAGWFYALYKEKLASVARKFEERAAKIGV